MPGGGGNAVMQGGALTIGRADSNDLVLPDPERAISSRHCVIEERNGDYVVMDISTNGTFLNYTPQPLGPTPSPLNHGDLLKIGSYEMRVEITAGLGAPAMDPYANIPPPAMDDLLMDPAPQGQAGFIGGLDDVGMAAGSGDAIADLLGDSPLKGPDASGLAAPAPDPAPLIPEDDDIFGPGPDTFQGEVQSEADHLASAHDFFAAPESQPVAGGMIPDDWDLDESPTTAAPAPQASTIPPLQAMSPQPQPAPVSGDAARSFLAAAELAGVDIPDTDLVAAMERSGAAYRLMVEGLRDVLMTRASIKSEFRLGQTMISPDGNNPIKFSVSGDQAVEAMVKPNMPGYLAADKAAKEAVDDIKAHEVAMMTGMQAAIKTLLEKFDPKLLAERMEAKKGLFGGKKAKKWDVFEKMYGEIAQEAEDDFQALFGKAFAKAYEDQLRKLR